MSFRNKGTTGPTVIVSREPDYSGNVTCDGVADDVEIQAAVDYVNTLGGGSVLIKQGTYDITGNIELNPDTVVAGVGDGTVLQVNNSWVWQCFTVTNDSGVVIRDLKITRTANAGELIYVGSSSDILIDNLHLDAGGTGSGINIYTGNTDITVINCTIHNALTFGITVSSDITYLTIATNTIYDVGRSAIIVSTSAGNDAQHILIEGNQIRDFGKSTAGHGGIYVYCGDAGQKIENVNIVDNIIVSLGNEQASCAGIYVTYLATTLGNHKVNIVGNEVYGDSSLAACIVVEGPDGYWLNDEINIVGNLTYSADVGIDVIYTKSATIEGNHTGYAESIGILINTEETVLVQGNHCKNNGQGGGVNNCGIQIGCASAVVLDNVCYDDQGAATQDYGIIDMGGTGGAVIRGNRFSGHTTGAISAVGTGSMVPEIFVNTIDPLTTLGDHPVVTLADNATTNVYNSINLPLEFQELVTAQLIVTPGGTGNMRWQLDTDFGKICANENYNAHSDSVPATDTAVDLNQMECLDISTALTGIAAGDLIGFNFARIGGHANDTVNADCYYMGIRLRYV